MLRITWAFMRHSIPRLIAAGLAIVVGTAFIAATLLGSTLMRDATYGAMLAEFNGADVIAEGEFTAGLVSKTQALPGVVNAVGRVNTYGVATVGGRETWSSVSHVLPTGFSNSPVQDGTLPTGENEVALSAHIMERLHASIGDELQLATEIQSRHDPNDEWQPPVMVEADLVIVGELVNPNPLIGSGSEILVSESTFNGWLDDVPSPPDYTQLLVAAAPGVAAEALAEQLGQMAPQATVSTAPELAEQRTALVTGQNHIFTALILAFAAVAMFVAALVVANTFQVIVAQRTRTLALLRATGATRSQVRRSVLWESTLLGVIASIVGILLGIGLASVALMMLRRQELQIPLPQHIAVTPAVMVAPLLTGAVVTWLAAVSPARAATRVAPVAALRPAEPPRVRRGSRGRLVGALSLIVVGGVLVGSGPVVAGNPGLDPDTAVGGGLALGFVGGVISCVGVLLAGVFVVAPLVRILGRVLSALGGGATVRLATANAARNPRRTSATANALIIGVGLVTLMSTGAASAQASLDEVLNDFFPADAVVSSAEWDDDGAPRPLAESQRNAVTGIPEVVAAAGATDIMATVAGPEHTIDRLLLTAIDPAQARTVLRNENVVSGLADDTIVLTQRIAAELGVAEGEDVAVAAVAASGDPVTRRVVITTDSDGGLITPGTARAAGIAVEPSALWVRLADDADQITALGAIESHLTDLRAAGGAEPVPLVAGPAAERQSFEQVIDALLAVVIGLLAVAVIIALIGVANTLSLSVIERRRESAVLRAMGLTRGQLRGMLATEGVLLALVGVVVGAVLGMVYGWAGTSILLGQSEHIRLVVPWSHLWVIVVVAVLAGLLASVLPARSATRTPPVAALAMD